MAIDVIKIYINGLRDKVAFEEDISLEKAIFINDFAGFQFTKDKENSNLSYYDACIDGIYIKYFPYSRQGELRIKFNIPKLMAGTNLCSIYLCNTQQIFERLSVKLLPLIDLSKATHLRFWYTSEVEINTDIIMATDKINAIYNVLQKMLTTNKYMRYDEYDDLNGGKTIYFIPKHTTFKSSDIVVKFYYKIPEMIAHDDSFNINDVYNSKGIVNLLPQQSILRMEIEIKRNKIYQYFKPKVHSSAESTTNDGNAIGTFEDVFTIDYQYYILNDLLSEFKLDKTITTSETLRKLIRSNTKLSDNGKKEFWNVVRHENVDTHKKKATGAVKKRCINFILSSGYNYLYADCEVEPLSIENIIRALPKIQQVEIALYKNSSIYEDIQLSKLTNLRVYRGKHY